jgi:hypothetical protein
VGGSYCIRNGNDFKEYFVCFSYLQAIMASSNVSDEKMAELSLKESTLKKHSVLLFDSSSDSDGEGNERKTTETNNEEVSSNEFFDAFHNKFTKKDAGYRMKSLKAYREDGIMQSLARSVFDFSMDDKDRFNFLFERKGNLKLLWQFIYLSYMDQDLMMLELRYKQHAEDFARINAYQTETGLIAKKMVLKYIVYSNCSA